MGLKYIWAHTTNTAGPVELLMPVEIIEMDEWTNGTTVIRQSNFGNYYFEQMGNEESFIQTNQNCLVKLMLHGIVK